MNQNWSATLYEENARFVSDYGLSLIDWLIPQVGEKILDLGCGDGHLTRRLVESGAVVTGIDASESFVEAARVRGLDIRLGNAVSMTFESEFDAIFSNAALHWMKPPEIVADRVWRALKPGGRFVAEMGGFGNIAAIRVALYAICDIGGLDPAEIDPWYFPTAEAHRALLERAGFTVERIELFPRLTPLPTTMTGWLETIAAPFFAMVDPDRRADAMERVTRWLEPALCNENGVWTADYVRLRFIARR